MPVLPVRAFSSVPEQEAVEDSDQDMMPVVNTPVSQGFRAPAGKTAHDITEEDLQEWLDVDMDEAREHGLDYNDPASVARFLQADRLQDLQHLVEPSEHSQARVSLETLPYSEDGSEIRFRDMEHDVENPLYRKFLRHFTRSSSIEGWVHPEIRARSDRVLKDQNFRARSNQFSEQKNFPVWYVGYRMAVEGVVIGRVLSEVAKRLPKLTGDRQGKVSVLDVGAMTSPGLWAAAEAFGPRLGLYTVVEEDPEMARLGAIFTAEPPCPVVYSPKLSAVGNRVKSLRVKQLQEQLQMQRRARALNTPDAAEQVKFEHALFSGGGAGSSQQSAGLNLVDPDLDGEDASDAILQPLPEEIQHAVVLANRTLSKFPPTQRRTVLDDLWAHVRPGGVLVLLEPGTPEGFHNTRIARQYLLNRYAGKERHTSLPGLRGMSFLAPGAHVLAPCPHDFVCPLSPELVVSKNRRQEEARVRKAAQEQAEGGGVDPEKVKDTEGLFDEKDELDDGQSATNDEDPESAAAHARAQAERTARKRLEARNPHLKGWVRTAGGVNRVCTFGQRVRRASLPNRCPARLIPNRQAGADMHFENFSYLVLRKAPRPSAAAAAAAEPLEVPEELVRQVMGAEFKKLHRENKMQGWSSNLPEDPDTSSSELSDQGGEVEPELWDQMFVEAHNHQRDLDAAAAAEASEEQEEEQQSGQDPPQVGKQEEEQDEIEAMIDGRMEYPRVVIEETTGMGHWPRLVGPVLKRKGHAVVDVCTAGGFFERKTVSRSDGRTGGYHTVRKAEWGDLFPFRFSKQLLGSNHPEGKFSSRLGGKERKQRQKLARLLREKGVLTGNDPRDAEIIRETAQELRETEERMRRLMSGEPLPEDERHAAELGRTPIVTMANRVIARLHKAAAEEASEPLLSEASPLAQAATSGHPRRAGPAGVSGREQVRKEWASDTDRVDRGHGRAWRVFEEYRQHRDSLEAKRDQRKQRQQERKSSGGKAQGVPRGKVHTKSYTLEKD